MQHGQIEFVSLKSVPWQGGWEDDEDVYQVASREAMEEAGVKGVINVSSSFTFVPGSQLQCSERQLIKFNA
jgi:hypothetical protein